MLFSVSNQSRNATFEDAADTAVAVYQVYIFRSRGTVVAWWLAGIVEEGELRIAY